MNNKCKLGNWVEIHQTILAPEERASSLPEETRSVPFEMWVKGYALEESEVGQNCRVKTITGRTVDGVLTEINPGYSHSFGPVIPELQSIGTELREELREVK
ncbi:MAG TPA: 2-amino-4-ketopentanoate thiolase [Clostridiales bacterium]|nr:2-amino-4-ketopentanoate thiolase [Clostridiales bacterium]